MNRANDFGSNDIFYENEFYDEKPRPKKVKRPKRFRMNGDGLLFTLLSSIFSALLFYATYLPYYATFSPGADFNHFAYVLLAGIMSWVLSILFGVVALKSMTKKPVKTIAQYAGLYDPVSVISQMFVSLFTALIFTFGFFTFIRQGTQTINFMSWFAVWILIKIVVHLSASVAAQYIQNQLAVLAIFVVTFLVLLILSVIALN